MEQVKRPTGVTVICILWFLGSILNLILGLMLVNSDLEAMPLLSNPSLDEWFRFGLPAELVLGVFVVVFAFIQMLTAFGLLTRKKWSYKLSLTVPILVLLISFAQIALYISAPPSLELLDPTDFVGIGVGIFWFAVIWSYVRQRHVQQYLGRIPPTISQPSAPPPQSAPKTG